MNESNYNTVPHSRSVTIETNPGKFDFGDPNRKASSADLC